MEVRPLVEGFVENGPIRLHYIDNQGGANSTPLVIIPGFASVAEDFKEIVRLMAPRRCVAVSLRGRGKSDTPATGYSLREHAEDIAALTAGIGLTELCLMAHSRGVPYAIQFARTHRESVRGLILLDFPAHHNEISPKWVDYFLTSDFGKTAVPDRVRPETVRGVQEDSDAVLLWEALGEFDFPVLVIRGGKEGSNLKDEDADLYAKHLKDGRIVVFEESEHDQWKPDLARFMRTVSDFLAKVDGRATTNHIEIRPMRSSDIPFVHKGLVETNWQDIPDDQKAVLSRADADARMIQDFERDQKTERYKFRVFVAANQGGEPMGYVSVAEQMDPAVGIAMGGILDFYVDPSSRRHGVGSMLLDHAMDYIRSQGYSHASIRVAFSNKTAENLYKRKGFYPDRIEMRKNLKVID